MHGMLVIAALLVNAAACPCNIKVLLQRGLWRVCCIRTSFDVWVATASQDTWNILLKPACQSRSHNHSICTLVRYHIIPCVHMLGHSAVSVTSVLSFPMPQLNTVSLALAILAFSVLKRWGHVTAVTLKRYKSGARTFSCTWHDNDLSGHREVR